MRKKLAGKHIAFERGLLRTMPVHPGNSKVPVEAKPKHVPLRPPMKAVYFCGAAFCDDPACTTHNRKSEE